MASVFLPLLKRSFRSPSYAQRHAIRKYLKLNLRPPAAKSLIPCCSCGMATLAERVEMEGQHKAKHWYKQLILPWDNKEELVSDLANSVVYEDESVIALHKPTGLQYSAEKYRGEKTPSREVLERDNELSVQAVRFRLEETLKEPLYIAYAPPRDFGGIMLFAKKEPVLKSLKKHFTDARTNIRPIQKYWAVCLGVPDPVEGKDRFGVEQKEIKGHLMAVNAKSTSSRQRSRRKVICPTIEYTTLRVNRDLNCSLIELTPSTILWDCLPLFLLNLMCPALGDHKYSCRLKHILGKPVFRDPIMCIPETQVIPENVARQLSLREKDFRLVPLHIHFRYLIVPNMHKKDKGHSPTVTILSEPDMFFQKTLHMLDLEPNLR